jgi:hypothetical protein
MVLGCEDVGVASREQQLREAFGALERGDLDAVEAMFAPDAKWRAPDPEWDCLDRVQILRVMVENRAAGRLTGTIEQVLEPDEAHALVAFRLAGGDGLRWVVLSFGPDGLVREMKGFDERAAAEAYAGG